MTKVLPNIGVRVNRESPRHEFVRPTDVALTVWALNIKDRIDELEREIDQRPNVRLVALQRTFAQIVTPLCFVTAHWRVYKDRLATHG